MEKEKLFRDLGLTDYETKAYLFLLNSNWTDANKIYKETKIPFGKIYFVLESLKNKGFVEIKNMRPKKYNAIPLNESLKKFEKHTEIGWKQKLFLIKETMENILKEYSLGKGQRKNKQIFWSTHLDNESKLIENLYVNLENSISIIPPEKLFLKNRNLIHKIKISLNKGIKIKVIISKKHFKKIKKEWPKLMELKEINNLEIRIVKKIRSYFGIIDGKLTMIFIGHPLKKRNFVSAGAVLDKSFSQNFQKIFDEVWKIAKDI